MELAGATINVPKSEWCVKEAKLVGYVCGSLGRKPIDSRVQRIIKWPACKSTTEVKSFLGLSGWYRCWIENFSTKAKPLNVLLRKDIPFNWGPEQEQSMAILKDALTKAPCIIAPIYGKGYAFFLRVDACKTGWGAQLGQIIDGKHRTIRYESGTFTESESKHFDSGKHECLGLVKALRKLRLYLNGIHFFLETDARVLRDQINDASMTLLPNSQLCRWLAYIKLFDFTISHIKGRNNVVADALSRKPRSPSERTDMDQDGDVEDFIDMQIYSLSEPLPILWGMTQEVWELY
jgi:hypothetical protein